MKKYIIPLCLIIFGSTAKADMNKDVLGAAMWAAVKTTQSYSPSCDATCDAKGLAIWTKVADSIIVHIKANAVVKINTFTATAPNVQTGVGTSGNITGTAAGIVEK